MISNLAFMGSKEAGLRLCRLLSSIVKDGIVKVIICPDDLSDERSVYSEFQALGLLMGIEVRLVKTKRELDIVLEEYSVEAAIVHGWYQMIPLSPARRFYGFHYSPLPRYRGNAPMVWQLINGEPQIAVSFFEFSDAMDEGDLIGQSHCSIGIEDTICDALVKANNLMIEMASTSIPKLINGSALPFPQPNLAPSYCGMRIPEDGQLNWQQTGLQIHNLIRAQTEPYPGAFTFLPDGRKLKIWRSAPETRTFWGVAGGIAEINKDWVVVCCGEGAVRVITVEIENEGKVPAPEVLRSLKLRLQTIKTSVI